ncbi:hypothetical protein ACI797_21900 [Geodermatophilus sp. SYSU D00691]
MTRIRRIAVLLGTAAAVLLGTALPAGAQFSNAAGLPTMAVSTVTVDAPTNLNFGGTKCTTTTNADGTTTTTLNAKLSWRASNTRGVSGYRVVALVNGFPYPIDEVPASVTSLTGNYDASVVNNNNITVTVTTLTSYGWTKQSQQVGVIRC